MRATVLSLYDPFRTDIVPSSPALYISTLVFPLLEPDPGVLIKAEKFSTTARRDWPKKLSSDTSFVPHQISAQLLLATFLSIKSCDF
jgi:hypothetical protein